MVLASVIRQSMKRTPMIKFRKGAAASELTNNVIAASIVGGKAGSASAVSASSIASYKTALGDE